jgi:uncharacterized protein (TIGR03435 family)
MNISQFSAHLWTSALFDHLWQSTAVLVMAWLLTLSLRNNPARIRYWIWMVASVKFLVPFSLLTRIGAYWARPAAMHDSIPAFSLVVAEVSYPFRHTQFVAPGASQITASAHVTPAMWTSILVVWLCGFVVLLAKWISGWRRAAAMVRAAELVADGPEFAALRRAERRVRIRNPILLRLSSTEIEPGIFGVIRPVLLWPAELSGRLNDAQIEAIMAHEVEHVCRRDNLTAAIHALVEALFWFHPLVRWMGAKMNEERERACDESVMEQHAKPEAYAESILKVCAFCMEPPTPCVSGVSGADLKDRILRIMTGRSGRKMTFAKKAALYSSAALILAVPIGFGVVHGQSNLSPTVASPQSNLSTQNLPKYDIASIKPYKTDDGPAMRVMMQITPDGVSLHGVPLRMLLQQGFGLEQDRIVGEPSWTDSSRYDIEAKVEPEDAPKLKDLKVEQRNAMMLQLLVDRFHLKYHYEKRELPLYTLVVAKGGLKMKPSKPVEDPPQANPPKPGDGPPRMGRGMMRMSPGHFESTGTTIEMLTHLLSRQLGRTVVDKTGLSGEYEFTVDYTPDNMAMPMHGAPEGGPKPEVAADQGGPSLFTAVEEQLGLKLQATKATVGVIVIDHIDQPSEN